MRRRSWMRPGSSTRGARYDPRHGPPIVATLTASWHLPEPQRYGLWRAICQAQWSEVSTWREAVVCFHPTRQDAAAFLQTQCSPQALMHVLELLVAEGALLRQSASQIETHLLQYVDRQGRWVGTAP